MKLNIKKFTHGRRLVIVPQRFEENSEIKTEDFKFYYDQMSSKRSRELDDLSKTISEDELTQLSEEEQLKYKRALAHSLVSLNIESPDIVDDDGNTAKLTIEVLDDFETRNLIAIRDAIIKDVNPNA